MKRCLLIVAGVLCLLASCQNELPIDLVQPEITPITEQQEEFVPSDGMIQLGRRLENPYSLENMRRALELLPTESRSGFSAMDLQSTHLYVKFKPKDVKELDAMLWSDSTLHFYDHPLDYEVVSGGRYYHDPSLPEGVPTYYYVSIPVGHPIPEVCEYEILEELYIPDELTDYTRSLSPAFINAIVKKSFEITGNEYECDAVATRSDGVTRASYNFGGIIRAWDDIMRGYIPIPGAKIKCKRWFTTVTACTDANGHYTVTRESLNRYTYYIYWERDNKYDIRDGEYNQAVTDGPETSGGWSLDIGTSTPKDLNFATITRAAYRYFYGNRGGLNQAQPMATGDLKICYMHEAHSNGAYGRFNDDVSFELTGDVFIYGKRPSGNIVPPSVIYSTTVHEMTHANQCVAITANIYEDIPLYLKESWAVFGQSLLFYLEYGELGEYVMANDSYEDIIMKESEQYEPNLWSITRWPRATDKLEYSTLFIDLYDNHNQVTQWGSAYNHPNDNITGYSASTLNWIVNQMHNVSDLKSLLKANKPTGVTDTMIDSLVDYISNICINGLPQ